MVGHLGNTPAGAGDGKRDLAGSENVSTARQDNMFATTRREPEHAIEGNDERERFREVSAIAPSQPPVEYGRRVHVNGVRRHRRATELGRTDVAVSPSLHHSAKISVGARIRRRQFRLRGCIGQHRARWISMSALIATDPRSALSAT
jgi:hypothetical protein